MRDVAAAVIYDAGLVLLARRKARGSLPGKWEFPGGKLEPGETPQIALRRELQEELALTDARIGFYIGSTIFNNRGTSYRLLAYRVEIDPGAPQLLEHDEIRWVAPAELHCFDLADSDRALLPRIIAVLD